jgi:hypothetical protein
MRDSNWNSRLGSQKEREAARFVMTMHYVVRSLLVENPIKRSYMRENAMRPQRRRTAEDARTSSENLLLVDPALRLTPALDLIEDKIYLNSVNH